MQQKQQQRRRLTPAVADGAHHAPLDEDGAEGADVLVGGRQEAGGGKGVEHNQVDLRGAKGGERWALLWEGGETRPQLAVQVKGH